MTEKEKLKNLIDNRQSGTVFDWIYEVEEFLKDTDAWNEEVADLVENVKFHGKGLKYDEKMVAVLRQLYRRKYDNIALPAITKRNQIFVAMMFSDDTNGYYEEAYKPVIQSLNYAAMRIDEKEYIGSIIGEIVKEIPDSVALIADLTGNRGGVYYEAGIAKGLQLCNHPIKLVLTCKADFFHAEGVHFDVSGDNILLYNNVEELKNKLTARLKAVLGNGKR